MSPSSVHLVERPKQKHAWQPSGSSGRSENVPSLHWKHFWPWTFACQNIHAIECFALSFREQRKLGTHLAGALALAVASALPSGRVALVSPRSADVALARGASRKAEEAERTAFTAIACEAWPA